jgi:two-component system cell cycle response regulator
MIEMKIEEIVNRMENLPTLPGIAIKILEAVKREETNIREIGDILSKDPPLTAKVLSLINSSFYGLPMKITSIPHAVNLLGINTVKNLALSFSLIRGYQNKRKNNFDYTLFWKSCLIGAVSAKLIAQRIFPSFAEDAFSLGLLHDIGVLALNQCMPRQYDLVLKERERTVCFCHEAENQILGFNHMEIGRYLIKKWGLPKMFYDPIGYHHYPERLQSDDPQMETPAKILHLSSLYIDFFSLPEKSYYLGLMQYYAKEYGFFSQFQVEDLTGEIHKQTVNIFPLFEFTIDEKNYVKILEEARTELINLSTHYIKASLEQKSLIETLREQAIRDTLTGLFNYKGFQESLEKEIHRAKRYDCPMTVILADVDKFKKINDMYGHLAGDRLLKTIAEYLKKSLRKSDIIARYGGDEFAFILPETSSEGAMLAAQRIKATIESVSMAHENKMVSVTMSFGIASLSPGETISQNDLIRNADSALYHAKNTGRNKCSLFSEITNELRMKRDVKEKTLSLTGERL